MSMKQQIMNQAKEWAELFKKSEEEFITDFCKKVDSHIYKPEILGAIISLSQCYYNFLAGIITREEAIAHQVRLLSFFEN